MPEQPVLLASQPGIKRDGTKFEGNNYVDGRWCRFQRGKPRKMGGYQQVTDTVPEVARGMDSFAQDDIQHIHIGHPDTLGQYLVSNGTLNSFNDRTPAGFATSVDNLWQFSIFADTSGAAQTLLVAHAAPNIMNIDNSTGEDIYIGVVTASSVKGVSLRGAGVGPAVLFWSLDSVIRGTFDPSGPPDFAFDIIATDTSIMSSQGVIEYDGIYYWAGVDRFLLFNGVVREIPNDLNQNFFFDNINFNARQKCFAFKVPRFGEIWWCFPKSGATECNHAVIFNVRENTWYDTPLPDSDDIDQGRTAGVFAKVYQRPFMVDNEVTANGRTLWQHETAKDKIRISLISAIQSFYETHELSMLEEGKGTKSIRVARIEPDFVQTGDMTLTVRGRVNTKAPQITETPVTVPAIASTGTEETIKLKTIQRLMSFRWESNVGGGDYEYGDTYAHIEPADGRMES
jgi:hypothetical protein